MHEFEIHKRLEQAVAERVFPGCVVGTVNRADERTLLPYGHFTYDTDSSAVTGETVYDVASITKSVPLGLLALKLIEEGRLSLDDRVITYLPEIQTRGAGEARIRDLLTYTYALKKNPDPTFTLERSTADSIRKYLFTAELAFDPGTRYQYSNAPANLLGFILERIADEKLYALAQRMLLEPLAMRLATFAPTLPSSIPPTEITSWRGEIQGVVHDEQAYVLQRGGQDSGAAGLFASASDLLNVAEMILGEGIFRTQRLFAPGSIALMRNNALADIGASSGIGWELNEARFMGNHCRPTTFGKTGFTGTSLVIDPERGVAFVILSNRTYPERTDTVGINALRRDISDIVLGTL